MNRPVAWPIALALVAAVASPAAAQLVDPQLGRSAANSQLNMIRQASVGSGYTIDAINQGILQQSRAYGAYNGFGFAPTTNTSLSGPGIPTMPALGGAGGSKPFASSSNGPTISPYLNLFNDTRNGGSGVNTIDNYNVLVRPMLEQQRTNREIQRQQQQLNLKVQAISARPAYEARGSESIMATGHSTGFRYYSHYYPGLSQRR